jgi:hypothetical protein
MSEDLINPRITVQAVILAAGASQKFEGVGGPIRSVFFNPDMTLGTTLDVSFGPVGSPIRVSGLNGVYIRLGGPVREMTIRNAGAGAINGQMITSPCAEFIMLGM